MCLRFMCLIFLASEVTANSAPVGPQSSCKIIEADATDGVLVAPLSHKVLFENADIRVLDITVPAHTREPWHTPARPAVMYIMTASSAKYMTPEDPNPEPSVPSASFKPVVAHLDHAEALHAVENVGDSAFHAIRLEFKHPRCSLLPAQPVIVPGSSDALLAASNYHTLLFENSDVRVLDVHLPPHIREPMHTDPWPGVVYILQGVHTRYYTPAVSDPPVQNPPPHSVNVIPVPADGLHALENTDGISAYAIQFELKHATRDSHLAIGTAGISSLFCSRWVRYGPTPMRKNTGQASRTGAGTRDRQLWVTSGVSTRLGGSPPILPRSNDRDLIDSLHI